MGTHVDGTNAEDGILSSPPLLSGSGLRAAYDHLPLIATRNSIGKPPGADGHHNNHSFEETWGRAGRFDVLKKFAETYLRAFEGAGRLVDAIMHTRTHEAARVALDTWAAERGVLRRGEGAASSPRAARAERDGQAHLT